MLFQISTLFSLVSVALASHRINVVNKCKSGTPTMYGPASQAPFKNGPVNIAGGYTSAGDLNGFIIYLQKGPTQCGENGENCLIVEGSLNNDGFSSVDISRIPPHSFNSAVGFSYTNGAGGRRCASSTCKCNFDAFCVPSDTKAQVGTPDVNASITVTFC